MKWLNSLEWARDEEKEMFESCLRVMEIINREISLSSKMVEELYKKDGDAQLLTTIP